MTALKLTTQDESFSEGFSSLITSPVEESELDLSRASMIEVLRQHEKYQKLTSPKYTQKPIISLFKCLNKMAGDEFYPRHINGIFYRNLIKYLYEVRNFKDGSVKTYLGKIRTALEFAAEYGAKLSPGYKDFKIVAKDTPKLALTIEEFFLIYDFDFRSITETKIEQVDVKRVVPTKCTRNGKEYIRGIEKNETVMTEVVKQKYSNIVIDRLEKTRDLFCLQVCLFQRHSDMLPLSPDNFNEDKSIYFCTQQKTGGNAVVDIKHMSVSSYVAYTILEKYGYKCPYPVSINTFNRHLHKMAKIIGDRFLEEFKYDVKILGEVKTFSKKLYEALSSHTARRTAITLASEKFSEFEIRECSGHQDSRSFYKYIKKRYGNLFTSKK